MGKPDMEPKVQCRSIQQTVRLKSHSRYPICSALRSYFSSAMTYVWAMCRQCMGNVWAYAWAVYGHMRRQCMGNVWAMYTFGPYHYIPSRHFYTGIRSVRREEDSQPSFLSQIPPTSATYRKLVHRYNWTCYRA